MPTDGSRVPKRSVTGDPSDDIAFLNHLDVYDGFGDPPALLSPTAVGELAGELGTLDLDHILCVLTWVD